jgi:hypothetical protein
MKTYGRVEVSTILDAPYKEASGKLSYGGLLMFSEVLYNLRISALVTPQNPSPVLRK